MVFRLFLQTSENCIKLDASRNGNQDSGHELDFVGRLDHRR
jgi:hypothetical protein